jgi:hypothetical protein
VDGNYICTAFGPTNVKIHQVCVALEFGDVQRAIEIGPPLDTSARLSRMIVREILTRPRPPRLAIDLGARMGIGSGLPLW